MEVHIPLPDMVTQHRIAEFWQLQNHERHLHQQILDETVRLQRITGQQLFYKLSNKQEK